VADEQTEIITAEHGTNQIFIGLEQTLTGHYWFRLAIGTSSI